MCEALFIYLFIPEAYIHPTALHQGWPKTTRLINSSTIQSKYSIKPVGGGGLAMCVKQRTKRHFARGNEKMLDLISQQGNDIKAVQRDG